MPEGAIYVGRPTRFGNPWRPEPSTTPAGEKCWLVTDNTRRWSEPLLDKVDAATAAVALYRNYIRGALQVAPEFINTLRGHDLVCWCPVEDERGQPMPCHADVLLELANPAWAPSAATEP